MIQKQYMLHQRGARSHRQALRSATLVIGQPPRRCLTNQHAAALRALAPWCAHVPAWHACHVALKTALPPHIAPLKARVCVSFACAVLCCAALLHCLFCRAHLRELLQAANADDSDGEFEPTTVDIEDEDDAAFAEAVASNLSEQDLDDFCTTTEDEMVSTTLRAYGASGRNTTKPAVGSGGAVSRDKTREPIATVLERMKQGRSQVMLAADSFSMHHASHILSVEGQQCLGPGAATLNYAALA